MNVRWIGVALILLWAGMAGAQQGGDAKGCVVVQLNSNGGKEFVNGCGETVTVFWCEVGTECETERGGSTWNIGSGRSFPAMRKGDISYGACRGSNKGGFKPGTASSVYLCDADDPTKEMRSAFVEQEKQRIADEAEEARERQQQAYDAAGAASKGRMAAYDRDGEAAAQRAGVFGSIAARNRSAIEARARSGGPGRDVSVDEATGGGLSSMLAVLHDKVAGSGPSVEGGGGTGSSLLVPDFLPRSQTLSKAAEVLDYKGWPGTTLLAAGAEYIGHIEELSDKVAPYWELYRSAREGDTIGAASAGSSIAASSTLPWYAEFFAVPGLNATSSIHHNAVDQFDAMMGAHDVQQADGTVTSPPPAAADHAPLEFDFAQRALIENYCDGCRWDEVKKRWVLGSEGGLVRLGGPEGLSVGWKNVEVALPSPDRE